MLLKQLLALQQIEQTQANEEVQVAEGYKSSADFDADMDKIEKHLKDAQIILTSKDFEEHVNDTDNQFDTNAGKQFRLLVNRLNLTMATAEDLYKEMERAA